MDAGRKNEHKELMLNTDLCLAYQNNVDLRDCQRGDGDFKGSDINGRECRNNLYGKGGDLFVTKAKSCCAHVSADAVDRLKGLPTKSREMCGKMYSLESIKEKHQGPSRDDCCKGLKDHKFSCDYTDGPRGPAFEDVVDFGRDEGIFFRKYIEAWHIATENGGLTKGWSDKTKGPLRHAHNKQELIDCTAKDACKKNPAHCHEIVMGSDMGSGQIWPAKATQCVNKHLLLTEQRAEHSAVEQLGQMNRILLQGASGTTAGAATVLAGQKDLTFHNKEKKFESGKHVWPSTAWWTNKGEWTANLWGASETNYKVEFVSLRQNAKKDPKKNLEVWVTSKDGKATFCNKVDDPKKCKNCVSQSGDFFLLKCKKAITNAAAIKIKRSKGGAFGLAEVNVWNGEMYPHYSYDKILRPPAEI